MKNWKKIADTNVVKLFVGGAGEPPAMPKECHSLCAEIISAIEKARDAGLGPGMSAVALLYGLAYTGANAHPDGVPHFNALLSEAVPQVISAAARLREEQEGDGE
jgi:hypothetical protein